MITFAAIESEAVRWAEARGIIPNSTPKAQATKTLEEAGELLEAATAMKVLIECGFPKEGETYQYWLKKYKDAVGDVLITLVNGAALADVNVISCFNDAYNEIKDRKGFMNKDGIFVKESN